jgi:hypothetical protein
MDVPALPYFLCAFLPQMHYDGHTCWIFIDLRFVMAWSNSFSLLKRTISITRNSYSPNVSTMAWLHRPCMDIEFFWYFSCRRRQEHVYDILSKIRWSNLFLYFYEVKKLNIYRIIVLHKYWYINTIPLFPLKKFYIIFSAFHLGYLIYATNWVTIRLYVPGYIPHIKKLDFMSYGACG